MMQALKIRSYLCLALLGIAASTQAVAADDAANIVAEVCGQCHSAKRNPLDKLHLTKEQWKEAIERMVGYGAEVPKAKLPQLLDYLVGMNAAITEPARK